ncbi:MAG: Gfo/Idh/MocA family oxidoreductase [Oscillospiraceae bacterium]|jgi:predicted dehydrogenase|nr:Gfo/Idh/MocA family oxidoreductase [Oscillospiraceae bacterium]
MINIAIVGSGSISAAHIEAYLSFPDRCRIVALADTRPENAAKRAAEYNLNAAVYASHEELLGKKNIDLVSICTPPFTHAETASALLSDGKAVLLEKPMAPSLEECDRIIDAAEKSGATLAMVAQNRFSPPYIKLKKIIDSGLIGRITHAQVDAFNWRGTHYYDLWWRGSWEMEGGGSSMSQCIHEIDLLCWIMGMPDKITAVLANTCHGNSEVEDISVSVLEYPGPALAQVTSSVIHHGQNRKIVFQGERAAVSAPWSVYASRQRADGFPEPNDSAIAEINTFYNAIPDPVFTGHRAQIDDVLTALEKGRAPSVTGADGRRTVEFLAGLYQAGNMGVPVTYPLTRSNSFYTKSGILKHVRRFHEKAASKETL